MKVEEFQNIVRSNRIQWSDCGNHGRVDYNENTAVLTFTHRSYRKLVSKSNDPDADCLDVLDDRPAVLQGEFSTDGTTGTDRMTTTEQTGTAATAPEKPKDLATMSLDELNAYIKDRDDKHRASQKHLKALARAKAAIAAE